MKIKKTEIKEEEIKKNEDKDKDDKDNIEEKPLEIKKEKEKEITNTLKLTIRLTAVQMFLTKNSENNNDKKIEFLSFFFRESTLDFLMKSNGSMDMNVLFGHFFLYDKDYKLDEEQKEIPYINPEFKCIVGTTAIGIKDKKK